MRNEKRNVSDPFGTREALKLGMPLGSERFAETICARLGIRRNTGKRGRAPGDERESPAALTEQQGFGF